MSLWIRRLTDPSRSALSCTISTKHGWQRILPSVTTAADTRLNSLLSLTAVNREQLLSKMLLLQARSIEMSIDTAPYANTDGELAYCVLPQSCHTVQLVHRVASDDLRATFQPLGEELLSCCCFFQSRELRSYFKPAAVWKVAGGDDVRRLSSLRSSWCWCGGTGD